ncbi:MAG: hypothetical protein Q9224_006911, partial [Gallowayella concinna]
LTGFEKVECFINIIRTCVAEDKLLLVANLSVSADDDKKEPRIAVCNFAGMPLGCDWLFTVALDYCRYGRGGRKSTYQRKMNAGRKKGVDEAARVSNDPDVWRGI